MGIFAVWVPLASAQDGSGVSWHQGEEFAGFHAGSVWLLGCDMEHVLWLQENPSGVFQSSFCGEELAVAGRERCECHEIAALSHS